MIVLLNYIVSMVLSFIIGIGVVSVHDHLQDGNRRSAAFLVMFIILLTGVVIRRLTNDK